jgi:signal transduction histidine kinase/CheY-like chemotaxis protein
MIASNYGQQLNLADLRVRLTERIALVTMALSGALLVILLGQWPFPLVQFGLLSAVFVLGWAGRRFAKTRSDLVAKVIVTGLTAILLAAMAVYPAVWLPFLALLIICAAFMLVAWGGFAVAALVSGLALLLMQQSLRDYPLGVLTASLAAGAALGWAALRMMYTALEWAWTMQQRADVLLEEARERQGELARTVRTLDLADSVLRRTQGELVAARKQADQARQMKEQFAANVSHELRTPLNLILGFSEVMCLSPEVYGAMTWPSALRQDVFQVYRNSQHLLELIDDILDLSRFEIAGFTLHKERCDVGELMRDAVEMSRHLFRGRPIELRLEAAPDMPELELDATRIRQVLLNLLANAARFTQSGTVTVSGKRVPGEVQISVSDTGPGIPADQMPHLFEEFYQVERSLQRKHGGTGLGLAISKRFVNAHDGRIWVESHEGAGSAFTFALPISGESQALSPLGATRPIARSDGAEPKPVFVADSDPGVVALVRRYLPDTQVVQIEDEGALAERVLVEHPQAIIHNVAPHDGGSPRRPDLAVPVPLIECSLPSHAWLAQDMGVAACLNKPVTAATLVQEVGCHLASGEVLVVDDDRAFCRLIERMLVSSGAGYRVRQAYDGDEALAAMRSRRPDLVLLDLIMPGTDGFQVREQMRCDSVLVEVPVVLLTTSGYALDVLSQRSNRIIVDRPDGLTPAETMQCIEGILRTVQPHYDERTVPAETLQKPR